VLSFGVAPALRRARRPVAVAAAPAQRARAAA
jgi:hypothetical protein